MDRQKQLDYKPCSLLVRLIIFLLLTNLIFSPQPVYAASNWYVTTTGDDLNSCTTVALPCLTINGAIGKAVSGDTIYVAAGTYTNSVGEVVLIDKNLTLSGGWDITFTTQGGTSIIDGQGMMRGITIPLNIVATVDSFTIQNGFGGLQGGGIRNNGTLTINNSIIKNNVSNWMGGGIFTYGILTINNTIISGNSAGQTGNSGGGGGGGIQNYSGTVTINNSTISNNTIWGDFSGSGISDFSTVILNNSTVSNNTNQEGIYTLWSITLNNTTISGNTSGGITTENGSLFLSNSTISNNMYGILNPSSNFPATINIKNSILANNIDYDCSGPITSDGYNLIGNSSGCIFSATTGDLVGTSLTPIDPLLGPLQDNGGPTFTQAPLWGSPAIDAGNPAAPGSGGNACLSTDQRGVTRPIDDNVVVGAVCDIGAVEFNDNTPKVVILPTTYNASEQIPLNLNGTGISVGDINDDPLTVTVTTTDANSQIFADAGSTGAVVFSGNGTNSLVLTGSVAQLNNLFAGNLGSTFTYLINDDTPVASVTLTITADDGSSTGSDTAIINITAINDAPVNTVPGAQTMNEDTALVFSAGISNQISVNDVDVGTDSLEITLSVTNGTLTLADMIGLDFTTGDGTADSTMVFSGTLTNINNALATLTFNPTANYYGSAVLTLATNDFGNTGVGGALTDSDNVNITVNSINDPPFVANQIPDQNATEDSPFSFQFAANTFSDPDVGDTLTYSAQLAGGGALPVWLSFDPATRTFSGTPLNADVGTVSIDVIADDGNGGTATDTFIITITNAPIVLSVTINQATTQVDPTNVSPILFTVVFSEPINVLTFTNTDITFVGTAPGTLSVVITEIAPNNSTTFEISVSGMTGSGTVTASIGAGAVQDGAGNNNIASTSTDNSVMYDQTYPTVVSTSLNSSYNNLGPRTFTVTFSENVNNPIGSTDPEDVTNPANYILIEDGENNFFNTTSCSSGLITDDTQVIVTSVAYNAATYTATVTLNTSPPIGNYRLFVCGTTSIMDLTLNALNNGTDYIFNFTVETKTAVSSLPDTGFAPNRITSLPAQSASLAYTDLGSIWLEIPKLGVKSEIVGVPQSSNGWSVDWLGQSAGWLNGTAFPSWEGNSVVTGHVYDANGLPGPFANIKNLKYGDQIIVHMFGEKYIFEVQKSILALPTNTKSALEHLEGHSYLTLITCQRYNSFSDSYLFRRVVRAVLVDVQRE